MIKIILSEAVKSDPRFSNLEVDDLETRETKPPVSKADPKNFKGLETDPGNTVGRAINKAKQSWKPTNPDRSPLDVDDDKPNDKTDQKPVIELYPNGQIKRKKYLNSSSQLHRTDGPAEVQYFKNGQIQYEVWCLNNQLHRTDGPALVRYHENGQIQYEVWYLNNQLHRTDGPAEVEYRENGQVQFESWYLNGQILSKEQWEQERKKYLKPDNLGLDVDEIPREKPADSTGHRFSNLDEKKQKLNEGKFYLDARNIVRNFMVKEVVPVIKSARARSDMAGADQSKKKNIFFDSLVALSRANLDNNQDVAKILSKYKTKSVSFLFYPENTGDVSGAFTPKEKKIKIIIPITKKIESIDDFSKFLSKKYAEISYVLLHELVHARQFVDNSFVDQRIQTKKDHLVGASDEIDLSLKTVVASLCSNPRFDSRYFYHALNTNDTLKNRFAEFLKNYLSRIEVEAYARDLDKMSRKEKKSVPDLVRQVKGKIQKGFNSLVGAFPPPLHYSVNLFINETLDIFGERLEEYIQKNSSRKVK